MAKKRGASRSRIGKQDAGLRNDVLEAIERVWPDGVVDMPFDSEESYLWDIHPRLTRALERIKGAHLLYEREAAGELIWDERADRDEDPPVDITNSRSYHLFFVSPMPAFAQNTRSATVCRLAAFVLISLLCTSAVSRAQTFEVVNSFVPPRQDSRAGLIQASDGNFYGTTFHGGDGNSGTVFKMDATGTLTILHHFYVSRLIQASDGSLYGTTSEGGAANAGVVFRLRPDSTWPEVGVVTPFNTQFGGFVDTPFDLTTNFINNESPVTGCEYTTNGGNTWNAATVSGSSPNFTCTKTGIAGTNGEVLTLNMRATSSGGTRTGIAVTRTVDAAPPSTTSNLAAAARTERSVTLTWSNPSDSGPAIRALMSDTGPAVPLRRLTGPGPAKPPVSRPRPRQA